MRGIDISRHQTLPLNGMIAEAYKVSDFVIVKATQGIKYDYTSYFHNAIKQVLKDGKLAGAYHYASTTDPVAEAAYFASVIKPYIGKIIAAVDWESGSNKAWGDRNYIKKFVTHFKKLTGLTCFLYTGRDGIKQCTNVVDICPLWFARYPKNENSWSVPKWPSTFSVSPWKAYSIWQFTSGNDELDRNTSRMTKAQWLDYCKSTITQAPKQEVGKVVRVGSARIDERGKVSGGKAGDQTGKEVSIQNWYLHKKGWVVIRAKSQTMRTKIAQDMEYACNNSNIGYDQSQNSTLWNIVKPLGFNCSKVRVKCETDCARLVRVCCWYAGSKPTDFYTGSEVSALRATGDFDILTDSKYTTSSDYLMRGDILVTKTKGHTVVVLDNGSKIKTTDTTTSKGNKTTSTFKVEDIKMPTIRRGSEGKAVKIWQVILGNVEVDGSFGPDTEKKTKAFQKAHKLTEDGVVGPKTWEAGLETV